MTESPADPHQTVAAGNFGVWLAGARASLRGEAGNEVPCGDCVGCCTSSYYIPLRPRDSATLEQVPAGFLTKSRDAAGHWMMGYRANGHCPMFTVHGCRVYATRPQTCRDYDCRIFAAAGIDAGGTDKAIINRRVRAWVFSYASDAERDMHDAVRRSARFMRDHDSRFAPGSAPNSPTRIAVMAIQTYELFMSRDPDDSPDDIVRKIADHCARFAST